MCKTLANKMNITYNTAIIGSCFCPGNRLIRLHNVLITSLQNGVCPILVDSNTLRDWIYVEDVVSMLYQIGKRCIYTKDYYSRQNRLTPLKELLLRGCDIVNPSLEMVFG